MVDEPCGSIAFGTVVTKRYMPFARVLAQSLREHHPDVPVTVVLVDDFDDTFDRDADRFTILPLNALGIPDLADVRSRYSGFQLTVVAKPYLLRHLLDQGVDAAVFLDADILVVDAAHAPSGRHRAARDRADASLARQLVGAGGGRTRAQYPAVGRL